MWVPLLLLSSVVAILACARLCQVSLAAAEAAENTLLGPTDPEPRLTLYETAYLRGGPRRVTDLALLTLQRQRRLLLAHTGWVTVVHADAGDHVERSVIAAIGGPGGQSTLPPVRSAPGVVSAVGDLAERLAGAGLTVPEAVRAEVRSALAHLRMAALFVLLTGGAAELLWGAPEDSAAPGLWFALPLLLILGTLVVARFEIHPYTRWASPEGERLLIEVTRESRYDRVRREGADAGTGPGPETERALTDFALHGPIALPDPALRAALGGARLTRRER
ncbi:TIGR04222 domain-containing membrane protein [Streptomyces sp. AJS327]|uniref:TIGR04222 domain-containing membrane protein n=1 Tax=Streptomyces sp. AJS327 TaxID=2545265 RepID=UPI0015DDB327|nr:TIGR04222 domain-containing membrane protein [Streptomyces sp. AJS327]MBA0052061.1 TIGR04222 domain-containing membrane protein [Streptomyces sp. AJS327]